MNIEGAPKFEEEQQPSPLTLMKFADVVEKLKKKYLPANRSANSLIDPDGAGTFDADGERMKILTVFYAEKLPLDATADVLENLQKIVASASVDESSTDTPEKKRHHFILKNGRIEEKIDEMKKDKSTTPVIISRDISDEHLNDFIDKKLQPFLE